MQEDTPPAIMQGMHEVLAKPTLTVEEAAPLLGLNKSTLYALIARDECPVPYIKLGAGRRPAIRIPTAPLRKLLGLTETAATEKVASLA